MRPFQRRVFPRPPDSRWSPLPHTPACFTGARTHSAPRPVHRPLRARPLSRSPQCPAHSGFPVRTGPRRTLHVAVPSLSCSALGPGIWRRGRCFGGTCLGGGGMSSLVRRLHMCAWGPISECDTYTWRHATSVCHIPWGAHVGHVAHVAHPGSSVFAFVVSESFVGRCGGRAGGLVPDYFCFGLLVSCREEARFPLHLPVHT